MPDIIKETIHIIKKRFMEKERNAGARRSCHEDGVGTVSWTGK